jgi:DNA primase
MNYSYPEELIEEIRINNDIVDVVSEYVKLERKGKDYFGLCPFHKEKTASFSVVATKQIFYCFGCGKGGNVIHFIMNAENLDFIESIKLLADRARIQLPEGDSNAEIEKAQLKKEVISINTEAAKFYFNILSSKNGEVGKKYLTNRKISENTIKKFGIGYSRDEWDLLYKHLLEKGFDEKNILKSGLILPNKNGGFYDRFRSRVIFPIFDVRGNVIGFGGRVLDGSMPKYMNSPETIVYNKGRNLYALNTAKNAGEKRLIIVEGYMDVISLHQNGIINTVASLGTALTESQGRILKKYAEEVIISYDSDSAGQAATMRGLDLLNDLGCSVKVLIIPEGKDPDEFVSKNGSEEFRKLINNSISLVEYKIKILKKEISTETTEGKIKFLNKVADLLTKIDNSVEREMYIKKLAKDYEISEDSIFSEIYRRIKPKTNFRTTVISNSEFNKKTNIDIEKQNDLKIVHDERMILALLCVENSVYKSVKDSLSVEEFVDEDNRRLAKIIFERLDSNKGIVSGELMNVLETSISNNFAKIINEECHCDDNKKAILDKIRSIKLFKIEKRKKEILGLLKTESNLNEGDVGKLKAELNTLIILQKKI